MRYANRLPRGFDCLLGRCAPVVRCGGQALKHTDHTVAAATHRFVRQRVEQVAREQHEQPEPRDVRPAHLQ
jgi:hypothetical protein